MKKMLLLMLAPLPFLQAMEGPTKRTRMASQTSHEYEAIKTQLPIEPEQEQKSSVRSLRELAARKFLKIANFSYGFPQGFYELPLELQEYLIMQPIPNRMGRTWLHEAKTTHDIDLVVDLTTQYINRKDNLSNTAFNSFIQSGMLDLAKYLLTKFHHVDVISGNEKLIYPLHMAIRFRDNDLAQAIIERIKEIPESELTRGMDIMFPANIPAEEMEERKKTILHEKAKEKRLVLLNPPDITFDPDAPLEDGSVQNTLLLALSYQLPKVIYALEEAGMPFDLADDEDNNPIMLLLKSYNDDTYEETVELLDHLLSLNFDINSIDKLGNNALMNLIETLNSDIEKSKVKETIQPIIRLLIAKGLDINHSNEDEKTALMNAAIFDPKIIPLLIELGADETIRSGFNKTALDYLKESNLESLPLYEEALKKRDERPAQQWKGLQKEALEYRALEQQGLENEIEQLLHEYGSDHP